jgi:hypothetical protein
MLGETANLEGLAESLLEEVGLDEAPVDAFELAAMCGLQVFPGGFGGGCLLGRRVMINRRAPHHRRHGLCAHEVAHWALQRAGDLDDEDSARFVSGALLVPRRALDRHLRETWNFERLREHHANASAEMIARRIPCVREAVVTIVDNGRVKARLCSPSLAAVPEMTPIESDLLDEALFMERTARESDRLYAVPIISFGWRRVIIVADAALLAGG